VGQHFEKDVTADEERTYYYFNGQRVAMVGKDGVQYIAGDHLGTTSLVLDDQGSKVAESRHYPYGEERWRWPEEGTFPTDHRFTGQRLHSYTQLYHMGARHYDPALGRWISADTLVPDPSSPQSFNRYSWVLGNPLKLVDPNGEAGVPPKLIRGASGTFLECGLRGRPTHYQLMGMGEFDDTHNMFDAIGLRLDASAGKAVAADINAEGLWNVNTQDFDIYWTPGLQGPSIGLDVSFGVIAAFGLRDNAGYEGSSSIYGGTLDIGIGIEIDVAVSDTPYQGMTPVVVFVGVGLGAEAGIYFGESVTRHVVDSDELIDDFNALIEGIRAK
jgi:RHS repeat-associated protein